MLSPTIEKALNDQVNAEMYSAYLYMSMNAYFESLNLKGFANWMQVQAQEEMMHAMKFYAYINDRGGRVLLQKIDEPPHDWHCSLAVFEESLKHEQYVTGLINNLVNLAIDERDHATNNFLQWFVAEQVEEESSVSDIVNKLKFVVDDASGLFMLDRELAARVFVPPQANA